MKCNVLQHIAICFTKILLNMQDTLPHGLRERNLSLPLKLSFIYSSLDWDLGVSVAGPEGYPRVLDYSIFKSLLVPYPKNFTTRPSS